MSKQISITAPLSHSTVAHYLLYYLNRGSQEERITILKMAITEKGIVPGSHYDLAPMSDSDSQQPNLSESQASYTTSTSAIWL